jgi:hypothetical protein
VKFWIRIFIIHIISVVIGVILGIPISFLNPPKDERSLWRFPMHSMENMGRAYPWQE